jgi:asparagine synthetase B (glutamine-hydrolysing)
MTNVITHRGPDGEGHWVNANGIVGFGHRRLSIIDLTESGKQPMHYAQGKYTITFNGEIYVWGLHNITFPTLLKPEVLHSRPQSIE